jgi:hypothetical protein
MASWHRISSDDKRSYRSPLAIRISNLSSILIALDVGCRLLRESAGNYP